MDEAVWDVTVFTKNRERLLEGEIAQEFFEAVLRQAEEQGLLSDEHFTVDGTLIEAWRVGGVFRRRRSRRSEGRGAEGGRRCETRTKAGRIRKRGCTRGARREKRDPVIWDTW